MTLIRVSGVSVAPVAVDAVGNLLGRRGHLPSIWSDYDLYEGSHCFIHGQFLLSILSILFYNRSPLCNLRSIGGTDLDLLKPLVAVPITAGISLQWFIKVSIWSILIESWKWLWSFYRKRDGNKLWCVPPWFLKLHSWKSFQFHLILFQFLQTFCVWIC